MPFFRPSQGHAATVGFLALVSTACLVTARPAQAQLTLTSAGTALGFSLSTFASGFVSNSYGAGPYGIAFPATGGVLVSDDPGDVLLFPTDTDGQNAATTPVTQSYGFHNAVGLAQVGGGIYMTQYANTAVVQISSAGTFGQTIVSGLGGGNGIVGNPSNGHLYVSNQNNSIFEVNPLTKTMTTLVSGYNIDGVSLSADGQTVYAADDVAGHVRGFSTANGSLVFDSGAVTGGVDGTAVGYGNLAGNIFVNTNGGTFVEINLATKAQTLIASGGSRGDFVTVDPTNGTLLLTQSNTILRLSGGNFAAPEPSGLAGVGLPLVGVAALACAARRRSRKD